MEQLKSIKIQFATRTDDLIRYFLNAGEFCDRHIFTIGDARRNGKRSLEGIYRVLQDGNLEGGITEREYERLDLKERLDVKIDLFDGTNISALVDLDFVLFALLHNATGGDVISKIDTFDVHAHDVKEPGRVVRFRMSRDGRFYVEHIRKAYEASRVALPHQASKSVVAVP